MQIYIIIIFLQKSNVWLNFYNNTGRAPTLTDMRIKLMKDESERKYKKEIEELKNEINLLKSQINTK